MFEESDGDVERKTNIVLPYMYLVVLCTLCITLKKEQSWTQYSENIYLGCADNVKGYCLWNPTSHKIVVSRVVFFLQKVNYKMNRQMKLYKEHYHSKNKEEAFK